MFFCKSFIPNCSRVFISSRAPNIDEYAKIKETSIFRLRFFILDFSKPFKSFGKIGEKIGLTLSKTYAVCCIFAMIGGWNLFQINAMTAQYTEVTGGDNSIFANNGWILGTIVAIITWFTIIYI